ncbi:MAG: lysophospholipid acyltransferase family protein [Pseudomonadales bacterium]
MHALISLRSFLFYCGYVPVTVVWGTLSVLVGWALPFRSRYRFIIGYWTKFSLWWLRVTCKIDHAITGEEHLRHGPCVLLVKHQSTWETLFIQTLVSPQTTLIKKELLWIPFFGWALALLRPIAIDRNRRLGALRQLIEQGRARLDEGTWVTLFPEGTRLAVGTKAPMGRGGAALAVASGKPVIVVAHNAGRFWPAHSFKKHAGTIQVRISAPIVSNNKKSKEINELAEKWLERTMLGLDV